MNSTFYYFPRMTSYWLIVFLCSLITHINFYACIDCNMALGMENKTIPNSRITAAQRISRGDAHNARLNNKEYWCTVGGASYNPGSFSPDNYLQVDLTNDHTVTSILLQGKTDDSSYSYGTKIQIQWGNTFKSDLIDYKINGSITLPTKNLKNNQIEKFEFNPPLCARYVRYLPFVSENHKCIRLEIVGCKGCMINTTESTQKSSKATSKLTTKLTSKSSTMQPQETKSTSSVLVPTTPSKKSDSDTLMIVLIVVILIVLIIAVIISFWFRYQIRDCCRHFVENNNVRRSESRKRIIKKPGRSEFAVKIETVYSEPTATDEPEKISLIHLEENDENAGNIYTGVYSEVYAAPIINKASYSQVTTDNDNFKKNNDEPNIYSPPVSLSETACPKPVDLVDREPIYAGSQIYENPYQAVTGSSLYADPNILDRKGAIKINEFPRDKLEYVEQIGEGQFGEVHICLVARLADIVANDKKFNSIYEGVIKVAVKTLKKGQNSDVEEEFLKEARVMARLEHENVVQLIGVCSDEPKCMVVEYMENGDLMQFLQGRKRYDGPPNPRISQVPDNALLNDTLFYISMQISSGMNYLSSQGFVHRDLATRNCLVGHSFTVKIADFGMSRNLYSKLYYRIEGKAVLPIRWMAPESLYYGTFTSQTDVWAFAVTVWEIFMFAAEQPYERLDDQQVIENAFTMVQKTRKAFRYLQIPRGCTEETYAVLMTCWNKKPKDRPTFTQLLEFFSKCSKNSMEVQI